MIEGSEGFFHGTISAYALRSLFKSEVNRQGQENKADKMIEFKGLGFEEYKCKKHEYKKCDDFLDHLQFYQTEYASIACAADPVGWNLESVFEERDAQLNRITANSPR